jgi:tetratricopeptide (TPR) repeat protein
MLPALLALTLALAVPAAAAPVINDSSRGAKLDQLFDDLKAAHTPSEALATQQQIVAIWMESGDPAIDRQLRVAMRAMDELFYDSALKVLTTIVVNRPDYVEGWNKRATLYYLVGNYQASLDDIAQTLALEPRHFGALAGKGMVMLKLNRDQEALDAFRAALAVDPALISLQVQIRMLEDQLGGKRS